VTMKIGITPAPNLNSYLKLLGAAVERQGCEVVFAKQLSALPRTDVTWIHWPELSVDRDGSGRMDVEGYRACLAERKNYSMVAWTVHNLVPHAGDEDEKELTRVTAELADVEFHLGRASVEMVARMYPRQMPREAHVIPHGGVWQLVGARTREKARAELGIASEAKVLLVFGQLRHQSEYEMALRAARVGWQVLVVGRLPRMPRGRRLAMKVRRWMLGKKVRVNHAYLKEEEVDVYAKACDAFLIARREVLNSGNVLLGMTFGKAVIGPAVGNVGEVLKETGNWIFEPEREGDLERVLREAMGSDLEGLGKRNDQWLRGTGQWAEIGRRVVEVLKRVDKQAAGGSPAA
jgi:glycosyltransferase involved in cell wall biosynthesis